MSRIYSYPENHWKMRVDIPYSMGVMHEENGLFALCGQADLRGRGEVQNAGNLKLQTRAAIQHIKNIVQDLGCSPADLTRLVVFYIPDDHSVSHKQYQELIQSELDTVSLPTITFVPLESFFYPGLMVEIDAYGLRQSENSSRKQINESSSGFAQSIRQDRFIFAGALDSSGKGGVIQYPGDIVGQSHVVLDKLDGVLQSWNASRKDIVKINNWYVGSGTAEDWTESARVRAGYYPEPGPVATGIPVHRLANQGALIQTDCWIMLAENNSHIPKSHCWPENHWDWPIHLPFKHGLKCDEMVFVGGQVALDNNANVIHSDDMPRQSVTCMDNIDAVLRGLNAGFNDVYKMNSYYVGLKGEQDLHQNLEIRSSHFKKPGPASTGIPFRSLSYPGMLTEFEAIAIVD